MPSQNSFTKAITDLMHHVKTDEGRDDAAYIEELENKLASALLQQEHHQKQRKNAEEAKREELERRKEAEKELEKLLVSQIAAHDAQRILELLAEMSQILDRNQPGGMSATQKTAERAAALQDMLNKIHTPSAHELIANSSAASYMEQQMMQQAQAQLMNSATADALNMAKLSNSIANVANIVSGADATKLAQTLPPGKLK